MEKKVSQENDSWIIKSEKVVGDKSALDLTVKDSAGTPFKVRVLPMRHISSDSKEILSFCSQPSLCVV
jgi:hypothetical protein